MISRKRAGNSNIIYAFTMMNVVMEKVLALACDYFVRYSRGSRFFKRGWLIPINPGKKKTLTLICPIASLKRCS